MIKSLCILFISLFFDSNIKSSKEIFVCNNAKIWLYSEAPLENIEATSIKGFSVYNPQTGEIQFNIPINSFKFKRSLMQEHFNENYMESDIYPYAKFKGKFNQTINFETDGEYSVGAIGDLEVHGVKRLRTINGIVKINEGVITMNSKFEVRCEDHKIRIPKLVFEKIAETVQITLSATYIPFNAK